MLQDPLAPLNPNTTPLLCPILLQLRLGIFLLGFGIKLLGEQGLASQAASRESAFSYMPGGELRLEINSC